MWMGEDLGTQIAPIIGLDFGTTYSSIALIAAKTVGSRPMITSSINPGVVTPRLRNGAVCRSS